MNSELVSFRRRLEALRSRTRQLLSLCPEDQLFEPIRAMENRSFGVALIRSAAEIEVAFGGITTRLWDDPFEWTLPESLATKAEISKYLDEVAVITERGLATLNDDSALTKLIPAPEQLKPIGEVLQHALSAADLNFERAKAALDLLRARDTA